MVVFIVRFKNITKYRRQDNSIFIINTHQEMSYKIWWCVQRLQAIISHFSTLYYINKHNSTLHSPPFPYQYISFNILFIMLFLLNIVVYIQNKYYILTFLFVVFNLNFSFLSFKKTELKKILKSFATKPHN